MKINPSSNDEYSSVNAAYRGTKANGGLMNLTGTKRMVAAFVVGLGTAGA